MNDKKIELEKMFPKIYLPDWEELKKTKSEALFEEAAFELLKEAGVYATLVAALIPDVPHNRNEAILCALVAKSAKLSKAIIAMTVHLGGDRQLALTRELIETLAILSYLLNDTGDGKRFDQYILNSLVIEKEFVNTISTNVKKRKKQLTIEDSMLRSVIKTAKAAGIDDISTLPSRKDINWPKIEQLIGLIDSNLYLAYRSGSGVIHTQWDDLIRNHLTLLEDGKFEVKFEEGSITRPQPLYSSALLLSVALKEYLNKRRPEVMIVFSSKFNDLEERLWKLYAMHSRFLDDH